MVVTHGLVPQPLQRGSDRLAVGGQARGPPRAGRLEQDDAPRGIQGLRQITLNFRPQLLDDSTARARSDSSQSVGQEMIGGGHILVFAGALHYSLTAKWAKHQGHFLSNLAK